MSSNLAAASSNFSFRFTTRQRSRGIRRAAHVFLSLNRSASWKRRGGEVDQWPGIEFARAHLRKPCSTNGDPPRFCIKRQDDVLSAKPKLGRSSMKQVVSASLFVLACALAPPAPARAGD